MPTIYRVLGYGGNGVLFLFGIVVVFSEGGFWPGAFMLGLGGLNLYLIRKIDIYSREEVWLEAEMHKRELRRQIEDFDREHAAAAGTSAEAERISPANEGEQPRG